MAPPQTRPENTIEYTPEFTKFVADLKAFHEKRGTYFDPEPRVGTKVINILRLYERVVEDGGYDKVSDEKLAWRKLASDFGLEDKHLPAHAFALKGVFYKYMAAYDIVTRYKKEPPPKEILEDLTPRGGGLLNRTLENFRPPRGGDAANENSELSGDDGTPSRENNNEEAPSSGGRVTRGLRHAPPQRILFQPETQSSRPTRTSAASHPPNHQSSSHQQQPFRGASSSYTPSSNSEGTNYAVTNYEPRPQMPLTLRSVITPGNNPGEWAKRQKMIAMAASGQTQAPPRVILPGTGFDGPMIYIRCLLALKSGIPSEQDYALHHLVKISMERGDKFRFESFAGLAELLIDKILEVGSLFYKVNWEVVYDPYHGDMSDIGYLDGVSGTPDILQKIAKLTKLDIDDNLQPESLSDALIQINEAALTLRNMVLLEENADYVSKLWPLRDCLSIVLNLPQFDSLVELKHYALEIAEEITKYISFEDTDPLYVSLLAQLQSEDRGAILTSLRAISRISMTLETSNFLRGVPLPVVQNIIDWTLLADEELVSACLDFLYQFTAVPENVDFLLTQLDMEALVNQLTRLLKYNAKIYDHARASARDQKHSAPGELAQCPEELVKYLSSLGEPERSSQWLRSFFEEDRDEAITQIALWSSYQAHITPIFQSTNIPLLPASEFIKNISSTFGEENVTAQIDKAGPVQKYVIKGFRFRRIPVDANGVEYKPCNWIDQYSFRKCGNFSMNPLQMYDHILKVHLGAVLKEDGKFENKTGQDWQCQWGKCHRFQGNPATSLYQLANHLKLHLPPTPTSGSKDPEHNTSGQPPAKRQKKPSYIVSAPKQTFSYWQTAVDEHNNAAGIPLSSVLILRNLARRIPKTDSEDRVLKTGGVSYIEKLFKPLEVRLFETMAHNNNMSFIGYMSDLLQAIRDD